MDKINLTKKRTLALEKPNPSQKQRGPPMKEPSLLAKCLVKGKRIVLKNHVPPMTWTVKVKKKKKKTKKTRIAKAKSPC